MPERDFLIFWIFLLLFSEFSSPDRVWTEIGTKIFSLSFSAYLRPFCLEIILERDFFYFLIFFFYFFQNFNAQVECERNSGLKFFSLFLGLSYPVLAKNNAGKGFFNFLIFFAIFFGIFLPGSSLNGIRDKKFFLVFSAYIIPFWIKKMPEIGFLIFKIFFQSLSQFSSWLSLNGIRD